MKEEKITRRDFSKKMFGTVLTFSLFETLFSGCSNGKTDLLVTKKEVISPKVEPILNHWSIELSEICKDLKTAEISQTLWQDQIGKLFSRIELKELLKFIDFEKLTKDFEYPDLGVNTKMVKFPKLKDLPENIVFSKKIFGMKKGWAIIPHGHSNMASAHLILQGEFSLKHFEKVEEEKGHLIIKPTIDKLSKAGDYSSISDEKDNVHWFIANSETAFTFDVIMLDLNDKKYEIHNLDIAEAEKISGNLIRARKIDVDTGLKRYGKNHHKNSA
jgi:predicted nucleic acid-binding protein